MNARCQVRRLCLLGLLLLSCFGLLAYRLVDIQWFRHEDLEHRAARMTERVDVKAAPRGSIYDRNGKILAGTEPIRILCADPSRIGKYYRPLGKALAAYLGRDEEEMVERLRPEVKPGPDGRPRIDPHHRLGVSLTDGEWAELRDRLAGLSVAGEDSLPEEERRFIERMRRKAIFTEPVDSIRRTYSNGDLAAHVLGHVQPREKIVKGDLIYYLEGQTGVEARFDDKLQGIPGWRRTERDGRYREVVHFRSMDVEPRKGLDLHLTLDIQVQGIVEEELAKGVRRSRPEAATVIVMVPGTGEILALANHPTFHPGRYSESPLDHLRNRAVSDQYEPGSTFKTLSIAAAISEDIVDLDTQVYCEEGSVEFMGVELTDDHPMGLITVQEVIQKSSNIGAFKIARVLGQDRLYRSLRQFGIGEPTGIPLPAEASGRLRTLGQWSGTSISRVPIGYEVAVTPLQITMAMAALANDGWLMRPLIVHSLVDESGAEIEPFVPERIRQVVSSEVARTMIRAMATVVEPGGTALLARMDFHRVAGKTGTARKYVPNEGYSKSRYYASFIGFFPAEDPQVLISVIFDDPKDSIYGGMVAGPVFSRIAGKLTNYLDIPPSPRPVYTQRIPARDPQWE